MKGRKGRTFTKEKKTKEVERGVAVGPRFFEY